MGRYRFRFVSRLHAVGRPLASHFLKFFHSGVAFFRSLALLRSLGLSFISSFASFVLLAKYICIGMVFSIHFAFDASQFMYRALCSPPHFDHLQSSENVNQKRKKIEIKITI